MDYAIEPLSIEWMITLGCSLAFIFLVLYMGKISNERDKIK